MWQILKILQYVLFINDNNMYYKILIKIFNYEKRLHYFQNNVIHS
jgi:hypothetical protein